MWTQLNYHDRPGGFNGVLPIPSHAAAGLCETLNGSIQDFYKILDIEKIIYPAMRGKSQSENEEHGEKED